ncbi:hypothetical protein BaRGS_00007848 [Batillaria attramentaria]|uniref:Uncharacterized protein n=1 Tax=Batillaria attramentaria TaxID=370345 RepID=A0ABD0LP39_9CAEN
MVNASYHGPTSTCTTGAEMSSSDVLRATHPTRHLPSRYLRYCEAKDIITGFSLPRPTSALRAQVRRTPQSCKRPITQNYNSRGLTSTTSVEKAREKHQSNAEQTLEKVPPGNSLRGE